MLDEKTQPLPFSRLEEESEAPERPTPRPAPWDRFLFALVWTLAALTVIALLSFLWLREFDRRRDAEGKIASAQAEVQTAQAKAAGFEKELATLEDDLGGARQEIRQWRARSAQRGEALRSTRTVLGLVTPLRTSYDDLGEVLTAMDADRDAIASAATALERDLAALTDYLRRTDEDDLSKRTLRKHTTTLRARLAALRTARASFVESQAGYGDASALVDSRFDELGKAVAALRKQIARALRRQPAG